MSLKLKAKRSKGSVTLVNNNGNLKLQWRFGSKRFNLSPGLKDNETNRKVAQSIATQIELDILSNNFDETLEKYRLQPKFVSKDGDLETNQKQQKPAHDRFLLIWLEYINYVKPSGRTLFAHYTPITKWLERRNPKLDKLAEKFIKDHEKLAVRTFNDRLTYLMAATKWAIEEELLTSNPLKGVKKRKGEGTRNPKRKPFSSDEIKLILDALWSDKFSSPYSPTKHSHYAPFIEFLLITGCRPAELIGLQWKNVDLARREIEISSVLARSDSGQTSAKKRVRKETKTGNSRIIPMNDRMVEILTNLSGSKAPNALVFTSPRGLAIDDKNLLSRVWKPVLEKLGIAYRVPYAARHSMASRAIEQGVPLTGIAYLMGHSSTRMVMENYGHMINRPELPSL